MDEGRKILARKILGRKILGWGTPLAPHLRFPQNISLLDSEKT
jgi:hypothetical protein